MNQSFDEIIKSRLEDFAALPPEEAKKEILGQIAKPMPTNWEVPVVGFALGVCVTGLLWWSLLSLSDGFVTNKQKGLVHSSEQDENQLAEAIQNQVPEMIRPIQQIQTPTLQIVSSDKVINDSPILTNKLQYSGIAKKDQNPMHFSPIIHPLNTSETNQNVIIPQKARVKFYTDAGFLFLYNSITPNPNDEVFIEQFSSSGGISSDRLGEAIEIGIHQNISNKINFRTGISFISFPQKYHFLLRNTAPDSVAVTAGNVLQPYFDDRQLEINTRLNWIGVNSSILWSIFPAKHDALYVSISYQTQLGKDYIIRDGEDEYRVYRKHQSLLNMGMKKAILDMKNSHLYLIPNIRYALLKDPFDNKLMSFKPFSVGVSVSWEFE